MNNRQRGNDFKRRTIKALEADGYACEDVERFNHRTFQSSDLFGAWDVLGVRDDGVVAVQCTSKANVPARIRKIADNAVTPILRKLDWTLLVRGFYKEGARWTFKDVDVS